MAPFPQDPEVYMTTHPILFALEAQPIISIGLYLERITFTGGLQPHIFTTRRRSSVFHTIPKAFSVLNEKKLIVDRLLYFFAIIFCHQKVVRLR
jgi:hypothetical protein